MSAGIKSCSISSPTEALQEGQVVALCAVLPFAALEELCFHNLTLVRGKSRQKEVNGGCMHAGGGGGRVACISTRAGVRRDWYR